MQAPTREMKHHIIITTPSIDPVVNVSGISTVTSYIASIIEYEYTFETFIVGRPDRQKRNMKWLMHQFRIPISFAWVLMTKKPTIIHINSPLNSLAIFRDIALAIIAKIFGKIIIMHIHGGRFVASAPRTWLLKAIIVNQMRLSDRIITLGHREAAFITNQYQVSAKKITVVPNAVAIPSQIRSNRKNKNLNVLSIGRISYEKGIETICELFENDKALYRDINFRMYGAGPLQDEATKRLTNSLNDKFSYLGVADRFEKLAAFQWADVILMPSIYGEGLPMALLEAMASGVVPITTDDGMILDVVEHNRNGFIVEKQSAQQIGRVLRIAARLKMVGELEKLSQAARKIVKEHHNSDNYRDKIISIYKSAIFEKSRREERW